MLRPGDLGLLLAVERRDGVGRQAEVVAVRRLEKTCRGLGRFAEELRVSAPRAARLTTKAGVVEDIKKAIDEYQEKAAKAKLVASPPGVPPPPVVPVLEPGKIGFVENAERWNSRASMVGWWSLLIVELVAGKGLLEIMGFTVGKGINFTF